MIKFIYTLKIHMKKNKTFIKYSNYMDDVSENMGE